MFKSISILLLGILCSLMARSSPWPETILHRSFAAQSLFLDTISAKLRGMESPQINTELSQLEEWATSRSDEQLKNLARLQRYRELSMREWPVPGAEEDLHRLITNYSGNKYLKPVAMQTLGLYYWHIKKDYAAALEVYIRAYNIYSKYSLWEFPARPEFQWHLGNCYYRFKDFKQAKQYYLEVFSKAHIEQVDNPVSKINTIALCYRKLDMPDSSLYYFNKAMDLARQRNAEDWIGLLNGNIADNLYRLGNYDPAIPMFEKDIELSLKGKDSNSAAITMATLADIYRIKKDTGRALPLMRQALAMTLLRKIDPLISKSIYTDASRLYASIGNKAYAYDLLDSAVKAIIADHRQSDLITLSGVQHKVDVQTHMDDLRVKENELHQQRMLRNSFIAGFALVLLFTLLALRQKKRIAEEKKRSDSLLLNILPAETAEELKQNGKAAARSFENVTILFTDFKDFTKISERMTAEELVEEINYYYSQFDLILARHQVEKIKTIGDSYMCAGGLPNPSQDHALRVTAAAVEMMRFNEEEKSKREGKRPILEIRIGIHTGPVVAGIVGINKFAYDIWGDAVNIAKRMESSGEPGRINISGATYERIRDTYSCNYRGEVDAKNKGLLKMYFVDWT